jgi:hypothetical protein
MPEDLRIKNMQHVRVEGADLTDVLFSHENPLVGTVNITRLLKGIAEGKVFSRTDDFHFAKASMDTAARDRDIDPKVVAFLNANPDKLAEPVLGVLMEDGSVLVIDGSHRSAVWASRGIYTLKLTLIHHSALPAYRVKTYINDKEETLDRDAIIRGYEFNR